MTPDQHQLLDTNTALTPNTIDETSTPTSTLTSTVFLSESGPWLSYVIDGHNLVITDLDEKVPVPISLPQIDFTVSGSTVGGLLAALSKGEYPQLSVIIYKLPSLTIVDSISLLTYSGLDHEDEQIGQTYESVRMSPQWSPNGRYLAFVGAIDGPSGDIYVYDSKTRTIRRLTSGTNQVGKMWWSPDSQWIVHEEISGFHGWVVESIWAAKYDGSEVRWLFSPQMKDGQVILGWTSSHSFVSFDRNIGWGECHIRHVDIDESLVGIMFKGCAREDSSTLDPSTGVVVFSPYLFDAYVSDEEMQEMEWPEHGVYLVSSRSTTPRLIVPFANFYYWDSVSKLFVTDLACEDNISGFQAFRSDESLECYQGAQHFPSPDNMYSIAFDPTLMLYDDLGNELISELTIEDGLIKWLPDSSGFLLQSFGELLYISVPDLSIKILQNGPDLYRNMFTWIFLD